VGELTALPRFLSWIKERCFGKGNGGGLREKERGRGKEERRGEVCATIFAQH